MVKKNIEPLSVSSRRRLVALGEDDSMSVAQRCSAVGLPRSSYYYQACTTSAFNLKLMERIDELYLKWPFYGVPRMTTELRSEGNMVNEKRIRRLMKLMNLIALYPKPNTSKPAVGHRIYPYLLRGVSIDHPNHVWSTDLTYIRLPKGWMYLMAVMDWYSRYVIHWEVSNTMDASFCTSVLKESLERGRPKIFNTDQGSQFTSDDFTSVLESNTIQISMDGRGRALDNVFIERLWRSVKYEDIYLKNYETVGELISGLDIYFRFYNTERRHTNLNKRTPYEVYHQP